MSNVMEAMSLEQKKESLDRFSKRTDKQPALYFVGRRNILADIEDTVSELRRLIDGREGTDISRSETVLSNEFTWLIQGAPGAGKSALLSHLRQTWAKQSDGPISFRVGTKHLNDESLLTRRIADHVRKDGADFLNCVQTVEMAGGLGLWSNKFRIKTTRTKPRGVLVLDDLWRLYDRGLMETIGMLLPERHRSEVSALRPVVLTIDEVQSLRSPGEQLLSYLHLGEHGLPIVAILAGLAWSQTRLAEAGISRWSEGRVRTLEPLSAAEATESVRLLLEEHEIEGFQDAVIASRIAVWSNGWPQHLHNYMRVLAMELRDSDCELNQIDEAKVREAGDRMRRNYYVSRLTSSSIRACRNLLADVAEKISEDGYSESELLDLLDERVWKAGKKSADCLPRNMEPQDFIGEMIRTGIAHIEEDHITIPIPSFRQHLIGRRLN